MALFYAFLEISRLIFLNTISNLQILDLEQLVEEFLFQFKECFSQRITFKMHHLVHYPKYIRMFGPLNSLWCMRFEAKHIYFKSLLKRIRNYTNIPLTLSMVYKNGVRTFGWKPLSIMRKFWSHLGVSKKLRLSQISVI